jgi:copper chaperone
MIELTIPDMTCGGCAASITRVVQGMDPAATVEADVETKRVRIESQLDTTRLLDVIEAAGFSPKPLA